MDREPSETKVEEEEIEEINALMGDSDNFDDEEEE